MTQGPSNNLQLNTSDRTRQSLLENQFDLLEDDLNYYDTQVGFKSIEKSKHPTNDKKVGLNVLDVAKPANTNNSTKSNDNRRLIWGSRKGYEKIKSGIDMCYSEIMKWNKNLMEVPKGKCRK